MSGFSEPKIQVFDGRTKFSISSLTLDAAFDGRDEFVWISRPCEGMGIWFFSVTRRLMQAWRTGGGVAVVVFLRRLIFEALIEDD